MKAGAVIFGRLDGQTSAGSRVYPLMLPQEPSFPAITYQQISSGRMRAMGKDGPLIRARVQLNSWGSSYAQARTLAGEVEDMLNRFRGIVSGLNILDILIENEIETFESETEARRVIQDYTIMLGR